MAFEYERELIEYINSLKVSILARPLILGGTTGGLGGGGGPPGGFIGQLIQSKVAYDTTEAETWEIPLNASGLPSGVSLVHNLNRIRYRIGQLEGNSLIIREDNSVVASGVTMINFEGGLSVTPVTGGVTVSSVITVGFNMISVSATEPSSPSVGDLWVDIS